MNQPIFELQRPGVHRLPDASQSTLWTRPICEKALWEVVRRARDLRDAVKSLTMTAEAAQEEGDWTGALPSWLVRYDPTEGGIKLGEGAGITLPEGRRIQDEVRDPLPFLEAFAEVVELVFSHEYPPVAPTPASSATVVSVGD